MEQAISSWILDIACYFNYKEMSRVIWLRLGFLLSTVIFGF